MTARPTGTVTFLFTDIEGSTRLWDQYPDHMRDALARHDRIVREAVSAHDGYVFSTAGDAFSVAFARPEQALEAALDAQKALAVQQSTNHLPIIVRMAIHPEPHLKPRATISARPLTDALACSPSPMEARSS